MSNPNSASDASLVWDWLQAGPHDALLAVGATGASLVQAFAGRALPATVQVTASPPTAPYEWLQGLASHARFDAAVLSGVVETLPEAETGAVLASLRDVVSRRFLLLVEDDTAVSAGELLALGLRGLGTVAAEAGALRVYEYDLARYKRTPDWLNASGWAHPENWGRYRW